MRMGRYFRLSSSIDRWEFSVILNTTPSDIDGNYRQLQLTFRALHQDSDNKMYFAYIDSYKS